MTVTYNWLKEFVKFDMPVHELGKKLTSVGPEVATIKLVGIDKANAGKITLAKILEVEKHPKADNLSILKISANRVNVQVITNSKAVEKGQFVVYGAPGAKLPCGIEIKEALLKGEKSDGMLLAKEHLNLEEKSQDIWNLGKNEKIADSLFHKHTEEDYVLEIELTANRSDCLSALGIAREVAAMLDLELSIPHPSIDSTITDNPDVEIEEKNLCPRYTARILKDIQIVESPDWVKRKLELCGIRPINNIVDATNYVMLEFGQPMHAFDLDHLEGKKIIVRTPEKGEKFETLDGQKHDLDDNMLMICDAKKPVALAGIMGGANSEILSTTKDILLESAYFDPLSIRKTAKKLGMKTESSYRFERGTDPGITAAAIERCTEIIMLTCTPGVSAVCDEYITIFKDRIVNIKPETVSSKIGMDFTIKEIEGLLKRLKFIIVAKREGVLEVKVPTFRPDVSRAVDIIEEIARIFGYNNIPQTMFKPAVDVESLLPKKDIKSKVRDILCGQGFAEAYNFGFTNDEENEKMKISNDNVGRLQNPLSGDASVLRSYLFAGLLRNIEFNLKNAYRTEARFYELGHVFWKEKNNFIETSKTALAVYGKAESFYTAAGLAELLLKKCTDLPLDFRKADLPFLHPINSAMLLVNGKNIGFLGEVHPDICDKLDFRFPAFIAELELDALSGLLNTSMALKPIGKFPPTTRDLSVVVAQDILARDIMNWIAAYNPWITDAKYTDLFKGMQIGADKKSVTFSIAFQSGEKTLTDAEVNGVMDKLIADVKTKFGAELRG